jgi:hypothetical protein
MPRTSSWRDILDGLEDDIAQSTLAPPAPPTRTRRGADDCRSDATFATQRTNLSFFDARVVETEQRSSQQFTEELRTSRRFQLEPPAAVETPVPQPLSSSHLQTPYAAVGDMHPHGSTTSPYSPQRSPQRSPSPAVSPAAQLKAKLLGTSSVRREPPQLNVSSPNPDSSLVAEMKPFPKAPLHLQEDSFRTVPSDDRVDDQDAVAS